MRIQRIIKDIVAAMTREPHKDFMLLVKDEKEKIYAEDLLVRMLDGILTVHRSYGASRRQVVLKTMLGTRLRIIHLVDKEAFKIDTCGVTVEKWWSTVDNPPEDIRQRLWCCTWEFQNGHN